MPVSHRELTESLMPFGEHLDELRRRLIFALVGVLPIFVVSLVFGQTILGWLIRPLLSSQHAAGLAQKVLATGPLETFNTYLKVSFVATIVIGAPWMLYQLWLFVAPGLYMVERRFVHILTPMSVLLTFSGVAFMFKVMLPIMLMFFVTFGTDLAPRSIAVQALPQGTVLPTAPMLDADPVDPAPGSFWVNRELGTLRFAMPGGHIEEVPLTKNAVVEQQYRISEYTSLILGLMLAFAVAFQMPVAVLLLGWVGIIEPATLTKYRRHAVFVCGIVGAIVTPTGDPLSMLLLAGPLYALYELGLLMLRILPASRVTRKGPATADTASRVAPTSPHTRPVVDEPVGAGAAAGGERREPDADDDEGT